MAKVFNESVLDDYYGGTHFPGAVQIFSNCAKLMLENLQPRLLRLGDAIGEHDFDKVLFHAHQLKGSFGATGSDLLAELCAQIEQQSQNQDLAGLQASIQKIEPLVSEFKIKLQGFLTKIQAV